MKPISFTTDPSIGVRVGSLLLASIGICTCCLAANADGAAATGPIDNGTNAQPASARSDASDLPPPPSGFTVTPVTISRISLWWKPSPETGVTEGYVVDESLDGHTFAKAATLPPSAVYYDLSDLKPATAYWFRVGAVNSHGTAYSPIVAAATIGEGSGLTGRYYTWTGMNEPNDFKYSRVDPYIDFDWGELARTDPNVDDRDFMVKWTGQVQPLFTEKYTFIVTSDDGAKLWVDGKQLIDDWTPHTATEDTGTIDLEAGKKYDMTLEYFAGPLPPSIIRLAWSSPSQKSEVVLPCQLYPTAGVEPTAKAAQKPAKKHPHADKRRPRKSPIR